ncbi:hypothetical protein HGG64_01360 [Mycoplasma phocoeninasale]|uniref:EF-hand domain-containing protein n=1 Tax=Mycoplasma phocoeninasale TaxID=2726117 RepID=A0A858U6K3_9MOLU|nr:hypothetical protein [Mycoplasma phocoeninasale]QJG66356.1 hypothetical protein HGG64_01360 [Mycoplasma phocoeninasale]
MDEDNKQNEQEENKNLNGANDSSDAENQEKKQEIKKNDSVEKNQKTKNDLEENLEDQKDEIVESTVKTKKRGGGFFKFLLLIFGLIIVGGLGYVGYRYFKNNFEDYSKSRMIKITDPDEKDAKRFNTKLINSVENENLLVTNREYKFGNLSVIEYPVGEDEDKNLVYFLDEEGIKLLNELFKKRVNFGPELNALNTIYINKKIPYNNVSNANGVYLPSEFSIYLFVDSIVRRDSAFVTWPVEQRVEMLLSVLAHEYTHHIDNVYNKSVKRGDPNSNIDLVYKLGDEQRKKKVNEIEANNNKFLSEFRANLNYFGAAGEDNNDRFIRNPKDFHLSNGQPIFRDFSAYDLFKYANLDNNVIDERRYSVFENPNSNYFFNNDERNGVSFGEKTNGDRIRYLYSFEELVPRELLKLAYTANPNLYRNRRGFFNYLYFSNPAFRNLGSSEVFLTAVGDDILKTIGIDPRGVNNSNFKIFSNNWVFDDELRKFFNKKGELPYENIRGENLRAKGLFKAYLDLMGYRQTISYIGNDSTKWTETRKDFSNINLGGYLKINKSLLTNSLPNHKISFLIDSPNKDPLKIKLNPTQYNFIAKKFWNQTYTENKIDNYTELSIYPEEPSDYEYVAYYSDSVGINEINNYVDRNGKMNIKLWIDKNDDGEVDENEIENLLNQNTGKQDYKIWKDNARTITNYRQYMKLFENQNALSKTYKIAIKQNEDNDEFWYEWKKY